MAAAPSGSNFTSDGSQEDANSDTSVLTTGQEVAESQTTDLTTGNSQEGAEPQRAETKTNVCKPKIPSTLTQRKAVPHKEIWVLPTQRSSPSPQTQTAGTNSHQRVWHQQTHSQQSCNVPGMAGSLPTGAEHRNALVDMATRFWRQCISEWYPNLHSQTYFLPVLYFNKVPYDVDAVAGQLALVPQAASDRPHQTPAVVPCHPGSQSSSSSLPCTVWPDQPVPPGLLPMVYSCDVRDDRAMQIVLDFIRKLSTNKHEVMMVVSQLEFRKYLDDQVDPISAAAAHLLPRMDTLGPKHQRGEFDILIISRRYGLILGEVKSVGADRSKCQDLDKAIVTRINKSVKQLERAQTVLKYLLSDLGPINIINTFMFPHVSSADMLKALRASRETIKVMRQCQGFPKSVAAAVVGRCLCADDISNHSSSVWWQWAVEDHGPDANMTNDLYETLVARFCGPATTVEVATVTTPRRTVVVRTLSDAVAQTGLRMAALTLHPEQVDLINRTVLQTVFLSGPPGTGKTVVLALKALQWLQQGKTVHLLSSHRDSRAATFLIDHQLKHTLNNDSTVGQRLQTCFYSFEEKSHVERAVKMLSAAAQEDELFIIADEAFPGGDIRAKVPSLHLWAASVKSTVPPKFMTEKRLTVPLRCPPVVVREVEKSRYMLSGDVLSYTTGVAPAPTDGPSIQDISHWMPGFYGFSPQPNHQNKAAKDCELCAALIGVLLDELFAHQGHDLQERDIIILCKAPVVDMPVVKLLQGCGHKVEVITSDDDAANIMNVALAVGNAITVADNRAVSGLERRVVIVLDWNSSDEDRLYAASRCTSLLVRVG